VTGFASTGQAFFDGHPVPFDLKSITEIDLLTMKPISAARDGSRLS
jgi:hypothetical protein